MLFEHELPSVVDGQEKNRKLSKVFLLRKFLLRSENGKILVFAKKKLATCFFLNTI